MFVAVLGLGVLLGQPALGQVAGSEEGVEVGEVEGVPGGEALAADGEGAEVGGVAMAQKPARAERLTVVVSGNLDGDLARIDCREPAEARELSWARQAGYIRTLADLSVGGGLPAPLILSGGDAIFPGPISRYLLSSGEEGARNLVDLLNVVPVDAQALGNRELSAPRDELITFVQAARERGLDVQAANLRCANFSGADAICEAMGLGSGAPFKVVERGGVRIAIASVMAPHLLEPLTERQRAGLELVEPAHVLPGLVREMRAQADLTLVQYHARHADALRGAYALGAQVEGIDLLVASHLFDADEVPDERRLGMAWAEGTGTPIVSADSGPGHVHTVELQVRFDAERARLVQVVPRRVSVAEMPEDRVSREVLEGLAEAYCEDWGQLIAAAAGLAGPFELSDLRTFIMNVMRFSAGAEVALVNAGAFRDQGQFPLRGELTLADVYSAMPFDNQVVVGTLSGARLKEVAGRLGERLVSAGLEKKGDKVLINGRAPVEDRLYRVALNDFLAAGGDGVLAPEELGARATFEPAWAGQAPSISELVVHYVNDPGELARAPQTSGLSARGSFPDLHKKFLWTWAGSINASYNQVQVRNPQVGGAPGYDQSQLAVASTDQINLEGKASARADSRDHGWDSDLVLQYASARLPDTEGATFEETKDLVRLRTQYRNLTLRSRLGGRWYVPGPLAEVQVESEFDRPETRSWHRLDTRGIIGLSFKVAEPLDLKIGVNTRRDLNEPEGQATRGFNAGYVLKRVNLMEVLGRPIQFESELEYFYNGISRDRAHELRAANRVYFAVFDQFFFTASFNAFLYQNRAVGTPGTNTELTLGLNYLWEATRQSF
ncbi:hypothetical protein DL240_14335 [Lujinxingia litoralis]|uniref:5'-Nucleotidase C-terminal domain-containing protein n=2 Tax=Lujinxingia litoralis TaxID=2211119 RepID=A0A328C4Q1_9DELT|nr:hypothetical protein DL240_14335 [Lujinxingia litoralis]